LPFCYNELPRLAVHYSKVGIIIIKKKITLSLIGVHGKEKVRKKLIKKNSVWLMGKIKTLMQDVL